jgi:hypothetical protein
VVVSGSEVGPSVVGVVPVGGSVDGVPVVVPVELPVSVSPVEPLAVTLSSPGHAVAERVNPRSRRRCVVISRGKLTAARRRLKRRSGGAAVTAGAGRAR